MRPTNPNTDPCRPHSRQLALGLQVLCAVPALVLLGEFAVNELGPNPLARLLSVSGQTSLALLLAVLSLTPLARFLAGRSMQSRLLRIPTFLIAQLMLRRRQLGLWVFAYASLHLGIYLAFDVGLDWDSILEDLRTRPLVLTGAIAFVVLTPMAMTSHDLATRWMGKLAWHRLHMLAYVVAALGMIHFWLTMKVGVYRPWPESIILTLILTLRFRHRSPGVSATPSEPRHASSNPSTRVLSRRRSIATSSH